jgi:hypothetical protein
VSEEWTWDHAFAAEDQLSFPETVRHEVRELAEKIVELAGLGVDPNDLGEPAGRSARRHILPCGGWIETQTIPHARFLVVVLIVPPPHLL